MASPTQAQNGYFVSAGAVQGFTLTFASPTSGDAIAPSAGDLLVVIDNIDAASSYPGAVTDWTQISELSSLTTTAVVVYAKTSDGTETAITVPYTGTAREHKARILRFTGADAPASIIAATATHAGGGTYNAPSVDTVVNECFCLSISAAASGTGSSSNIPSGTTLVGYETDATSTLGIASFQAATAGATGTKTWSNTSQAKRTVTLAIAPSAGGGAASITSVTGSALNVIEAGESFSVVCTGAEATQASGTLTVGGVAVDSITSWSDTLVVAVAPTDGLLFGGSKDVVLTPDSNTADTQSGITYNPPTGHDYMTFDSGGVSGMTLASVGWNRDTSAPYTNVDAGDNYYFEELAVKVDGSGDPVDPEVTATAVVEEGTGNFSVTDVTEPGDYKIIGYFRDGDGTDTALSVIFDSTAPTLSSAAINTAGNQITLTLSDAAAIGAGGNGGITLSATGGAVTATFDSVSTVNVIYDLSRTVYPGETVTVTYVQPGNGITDEVGNELASFSAQAVTNNSEANSAPTDIALSNNRVSIAAGVDAVVGTLSTTDLDPGDSHTYTLVAGTGDTDNASFAIDGSSLTCDDPEGLGVGTYSVRIQTSDGTDVYAEAFSITVTDPAGGLYGFTTYFTNFFPRAA